MRISNFYLRIAFQFNPELFQNDKFRLIIEADRLKWESIPAPYGNPIHFGFGYIMGRDLIPPNFSEDTSPDYDLGYEYGVLVRTGEMVRPEWDEEVLLN